MLSVQSNSNLLKKRKKMQHAAMVYNDAQNLNQLHAKLFTAWPQSLTLYQTTKFKTGPNWKHLQTI